MPAALLVRFNPTTPWRPGSAAGSRNGVQLPIGSDTLFAALTLAMRDLGQMEEWLAAATAEAGAAVRLSSMFPFGGRHLFVTPPANLWPPEQTGRVRWESARFIPSTLIPALLRDEALSEDRWAADPVSGCLLPVEKFGVVTPPFRFARRVTAAVDRTGGASAEAQEVSCIHFAPGAGMWFVAEFAGDAAAEQWRGGLEGACRLLADTGIGGERSSGWGKAEMPVFEEVDLVSRFSGSAKPNNDGELAYWLLSLFSPASGEAVDWRRGNYNIVVRNGRMQGSGALKKWSRMVSEGSVLIGAEAPRGTILDVAPEGSPHPAYRNGTALAIPIPWRETHRLSWLGADRAATEPPVAPPTPETVEPQVEPAAVEIVSEPVAEPPVAIESEPIGEQLSPEAFTEPGPLESEPIAAAPGGASELSETPAATSVEVPEETPDSGSPAGEPGGREMPDEQPPAQVAALEPESVPLSSEESPPDETPPAEPPTELPAALSEPHPEETPMQEPPTEVPPGGPQPPRPPVEEPPSEEPPVKEPPAEEPPVEPPAGPSVPVEEPPSEEPPVEPPPSGPSTPVEEPGPEPPERKADAEEKPE
jgi:CRISPR type III-A-associated RAMP protein Csm4